MAAEISDSSFQTAREDSFSESNGLLSSKLLKKSNDRARDLENQKYIVSKVDHSISRKILAFKVTIVLLFLLTALSIAINAYNFYKMKNIDLGQNHYLLARLIISGVRIFFYTWEAIWLVKAVRNQKPYFFERLSSLIWFIIAFDIGATVVGPYWQGAYIGMQILIKIFCSLTAEQVAKRYYLERTSALAQQNLSQTQVQQERKS